MTLSAPIFLLKRRAKALVRELGIPLHEALDRLASDEGFGSWSLLAAQYAADIPAAKVFARLAAGDLVLLAARPDQGKTLLAFQLAAEAMKAGSRSVLFSLEYTEKDCLDTFRSIGIDPGDFSGHFEVDCSDGICADSIADRVASAAPGTLAVIDYLQLLDQRRENPPLEDQVRGLKRLARERGLILVCISQIDRTYDATAKPFPDLSDVRLPNPVDLTLFDKACFLNNGEIRFKARPLRGRSQSAHSDGL